VTYGASENSTRLGSPVELYKFTIQLTDYLYTSQESDITEGLDTYKATPIQRSDLSFEGEANKSNLTISLSRNEAIALQFIDQPPPVPVLLYIYRYHWTDSINNKVLVWSGRIIDVSWADAIATMNCENIYSSINRRGLTRTHGPSCPYLLYGTDCGVSASAFQLDTTIESLSGLQITSAAIGLQPNGYYTGGFIGYVRAGEPTEYRTVLDHTGDTITINYTIPNMVQGNDISVFPGCQHNLADCFDKFNNGSRYGGFPYLPLVNPFNGTTLF